MKFRSPSRRFSIMAVAVVIASAISCIAVGGVQYNVINLGSFAGNVSEAYGLNDLGQLVGYSNTSTNHSHAFLYSNGALTDLGTLGAQQFLSGDQSHAYGINNSGQIVGDSVTSVNNGASLPAHAFLYSAGTMTDLGSLDTIAAFATSTAYAINNQGKITGISATTGGETHAFTDLNGAMTDLGANTLTSNSYGFAINATGVVAGTATSSPSLNTHPFVFQNGNLIDLGSTGPNANGGTGKALNALGDVVGQSTGDAFVYSGGVIKDLGVLPDGTGSTAYGIDDGGDIVGSSFRTGFADTAFIDRGGIMTNLNSLIDPNSGWNLTEARAINDEGQIVGTGFFFGVERGYLLTPVPEPTPVCLAGIAAGLLLCRRPRRPRNQSDSCHAAASS